MTKRSLATFAVYAAGTFAVAMAVGWPLNLNATEKGGAGVVVRDIADARITLNGIELTTKLAGPSVAAGKPLTLCVTAVNPGKVAESAEFGLSLSSTGVGSMMSRVMPPPQQIWNDTASVTLGPGETKTLTFPTASLPGWSECRVQIGWGTNQITVASISTPMIAAAGGPTTQPDRVPIAFTSVFAAGAATDSGKN
jgi:hypothetical protein